MIFISTSIGKNLEPYKGLNKHFMIFETSIVAHQTIAPKKVKHNFKKKAMEISTEHKHTSHYQLKIK